jgi:hypothetical protein
MNRQTARNLEPRPDEGSTLGRILGATSGKTLTPQERTMKKIGFQYQESMSGTYTRVGHPEEQHALRFSAHVEASNVVQHLRDKLAQVTGTLDAEDFADEVPMTGTVELAPLSRRSIRYDFCFVGNDGEPYRMAGQKDLSPLDLVGSLTSLNATIYDVRGAEVASARLRFELGTDLLPFLMSLKPAVA